jgi:matrix metalloproteinase-14 (membrane-inserted)
VRFVDDLHGCLQALSDNVLAHAYAPRYGGDVHVRTAQDWFDTSLDYVLAHEVMHSVGMAHTNVTEALMYPIYRELVARQALMQPDDQHGLQLLYGP